MKFSLIVFHPRVRRWLLATGGVPLIAFAAGCASPGPPQPPSLDLPEVVKDLTAERVGDVVRLHWTTPEKTTDHLDIKGAMTAEICRITVTVPAPQTTTCTPVARLPVQSGPTQGLEAVPPALATDPPALLAYRIQIFNSHGRSAGSSPEAFAASGAAPSPVDQLRAMPTRDGVVLEWQQKDTSASVEFDRLTVGPDGSVVEPGPPKANSKSSAKVTTRRHMNNPPKIAQTSTPKSTNPSPPTSVEVKLRTPIESSDRGGTIDHTARKGETYRYIARRVRSITLDGHALELHSLVSPPVTVEMRITFPPHAPSGLEAVPGGATAADRSIDLSWTPNTEPDLAGYIVYRQEIDLKGVAAGTAARLNATPVVGPAYRDQTAMAGRRYEYRVTAVDAAGNESVSSDAVQETLREQ